MKSATGKIANSKQMQNHLTRLKTKLKAWELLETSFTGLEFNPYTNCPQVSDDERWDIFVQKNLEAKSFREVPLTNVDNLRLLFKGKCAKGRLSFAPGMESSTLNNKMKGLVVNKEGSGDSDDVKYLTDDERADGDEYEESRSPIRNSRKRKSGNSMSKKQTTIVGN